MLYASTLLGCLFSKKVSLRKHLRQPQFLRPQRVVGDEDGEEEEKVEKQHLEHR